jgi:hypothetical protein
MPPELLSFHLALLLPPSQLLVEQAQTYRNSYTGSHMLKDSFLSSLLRPFRPCFPFHDRVLGRLFHGTVQRQTLTGQANEQECLLLARVARTR